MDPDAALKELRDLLVAAADRRITDDEKLRFLDVFEELDDWITEKGFLPRAWQHPKRPANSMVGYAEHR